MLSVGVRTFLSSSGASRSERVHSILCWYGKTHFPVDITQYLGISSERWSHLSNQSIKWDGCNYKLLIIRCLLHAYCMWGGSKTILELSLNSVYMYGNISSCKCNNHIIKPVIAVRQLQWIVLQKSRIMSYIGILKFAVRSAVHSYKDTSMQFQCNSFGYFSISSAPGF